MTLHDYSLANQTPASYRTDHNSLNSAIVSQNASSSGITTTFAHMPYADVSSSGWYRYRNAADSTFNYYLKTDAPGGVCTYAGSPSSNHIGRFVGQWVYDTSNNRYYYNTLAGTSSQATWAMVASSSAYNSGGLPKGYIHGLLPTYLSAASFAIDPGGCRDDSNVADISISTSYTVNITVSGAGGLSTSETESTSGAWYFCFAIRKSTDGTVNFILTNSSSGPVLPGGYDQKRMLPFAVRNTTQADFIPWQVGQGWPYRPYIQYRTTLAKTTSGTSWSVGLTNVLNGGTSTSFAAVSLSNAVPSISRTAKLNVVNASGSAHGYWSLRATGDPSDGFQFLLSNPTNAIADIPTSTAQSIDYKRDFNTASLILDVAGFTVTEVS